MPKKTSPLRIIGPTSAPIDPLDPGDLGPMSIVPIVPDEVLARHKCRVPTDTRFRAAARLLQSLWRADRDLPVGSYVDAAGKRIRLGSRITEVAGREGRNFLTAEITSLVRRECAYRELGALIEVDRLRTMTFNLFGPLKLDLRQASRFVAELFPGLMSEVRAIRFEHSPGRGHDAYTGDFSAYDVAFYGLSATGKRVLVAFEIKYSESGSEPVPSRISERQLALTANSGLYAEPEEPALFSMAFQQVTRELNMSQSLIDHGDIDEAVFVLAGPRFKSIADRPVTTWRSQLRQQPFAAFSRAFFCISKAHEWSCEGSQIRKSAEGALRKRRRPRSRTPDPSPSISSGFLGKSESRMDDRMKRNGRARCHPLSRPPPRSAGDKVCAGHSSHFPAPAFALPKDCRRPIDIKNEHGHGRTK